MKRYRDQAKAFRFDLEEYIRGDNPSMDDIAMTVAEEHFYGCPESELEAARQRYQDDMMELLRSLFHEELYDD